MASPKYLLRLGVLALFTFAWSAQADPIVTFQGAGADADVQFQFSSNVPLDTPGLLTTFNFNYCNGPDGESCDQVNYSAPSGVLRWVGFTDTGVDIRTFEFASYINNGIYLTTDGSPNEGTLTVTGSVDTVTEPSSLGLELLGMFLMITVIPAAFFDKSKRFHSFRQKPAALN